MVSSLLVLGGARSGKSRFAVAEQPARARVAFVATAEPGDPDMQARIARHRADRPRHWPTVEAPLDLAPALAGLVGTVDAILVDCLTLWVSNRMLRGDADDAVVAEAAGLADLIVRSRTPLTLVSNEVGLGVHPASRDGLRFRDLLGAVNQRVAAACHRVVLMVAGLPLTVKAPRPDHDVAVQAP